MRSVLLAATLALCPVLVWAVDVAGNVEFLTRRGQKPKVEETVVWLDPVNAPSKSRLSPGEFVMKTRNKTILPHVIVVPVGSTISFPNEDAITHNLFSVSKPNEFDLGLYKRGTSKDHRFDRPGIVNVYCNVHPEMSAVIHVVSSPHFTSAGKDGAFRLQNVEDGTYRLVAWNEIGGSVASEIEVTRQGVRGSTTLKIDGRQYRPTPHLNKEGKPYSRQRADDY
jgi:plastocyanin